MSTPSLQLPYILSSQAQKEVTHAEALNALDALVQPVAISASLTAPPAAPTEGAVYLVASSPTGAWSGKAQQIAQFIGGGWRFYPPRDGWQVWVQAAGQVLRYAGSVWTTVPAAPVQLLAVTVATLPSAAPAGGMVYVSDESGGSVLAFSDGTNWRRVTDRAAVS
jgi:predicted deacylase